MSDTTYPGAHSPAEGRSERDLEILARVGRKLLGSVGLDHQLGLALRLAGEALGANRSSVMLLNEETNRLEIRCSMGLPPDVIATSVAMGEGIAGWVAEHNQPFILHGKVSDARFQGVDPSIDSSLCLPLVVDSRVLGVLNLTRRPGARYTSEDLRLASSIGDLASLAVEKAYLYATIREREARMTRLLEAAVNAQEMERRRIADQMRDGFLQALTGLFLQTEIARMTLGRESGPDSVAAVESIQEAIQRTSEELREVVFRLCPSSVDQIGLGPSLEAMVDDICASSDLEGHFENRTGSRRLPGAVETIIFRIAQEALRNVTRHAGAHSVWVAVERVGGGARLSVRDDGQGFGPDVEEEPGDANSLATMRERVAMAGGSLDFKTSPTGGTTVRATIPLPEL
jgi:two-component system NarL family sensor kinase